MPTLVVYPTADGYFNGWSSVEPVGSEGWETVDDVKGLADDDTTYLILPKWSVPDGQASFAWGSASNLLPTQISVTSRAKIETGGAPELRLGFANKTSGAVAVHASTQVLVAGYATFTRTFTTNPFTSAAWAIDDMKGIEVYASTVSPVLGTARVTMLYATITYTLPTNFGPAGPFQTA